MKTLLKFELRRLLHFKTAFVCLIISFLYVISNAYICNWDFLDGGDKGVPALRLMLDGMDLAPLLISIFAALYACNDYSNNTLKNIYSKGFSRTDVYLSKSVCLAAYSVIFCLISFLGSFLGGVIFCGVGSANGDFVAAVFATMLTVIAYAFLCFMFASLLKKTGASVALCILGPVVVSLVLSLIDIIFIRAHVDFLFTDYWITGYFEYLTLYSYPVFSAKLLTISYIMSTVYIAGAVGLGLLIVNKQDI